MKKKLKPRRNRTHKMYGGFNIFGNRTPGLIPRALQSAKDTTLPFMYFYNFEDEEEEDVGEEY